MGEQEGAIVWSFSSFLHHLLNWRFTNSKGQEFYHTEKHSRRLGIVTLAEGSCLLLCPSWEVINIRYIRRIKCLLIYIIVQLNLERAYSCLATAED